MTYFGQYYLGMKPEDKLITGHPLTEYIHHAIHKRNLNFLLLVVGPVGAGKSYACLELAHKIDPEFDAAHVVFDPNVFAEMISNPEQYGLKKGSCIVFEEAGVNMGARDFQSVRNKMMSFITQTFRHQNLVVLFNTPNQKFIDINLRRLIHGTLEISHNDGKYGYGTFNFNVPDHLSGEVYARPMLLKDQLRGQTVTMKRLKIESPPKNLCKKYEELAKDFKLSVAAMATQKISANQLHEKKKLDALVPQEKKLSRLDDDDELIIL